MVLKRKRSDSEISVSSSLFSSPPSDGNFMSIDSQSPQQFISSPRQLFASRTRKRHRDNRPSEQEIHQHTLSMLFSAQQNPQSQAPPPPVFEAQAPISSLPSSNAACQQSSLHSFWPIPNSSARQSSPASTFSNSSSNTPNGTSTMNQFFPATNCEDCDALLGSEDNGDGMDIDMMDVDVNGGDYACSSCGKQVCHGCSVSNFGADRRCLGCAKPKKVWVGGLGWMENHSREVVQWQSTRWKQ